jgi:transposase InsO family protein
MFNRVPVEIKNEILQKIKEGMSVSDAAKQYAVSTKTIYAWLANETRPALSILEYNRLKRDNEELKRIIGIITLELDMNHKKILRVMHKFNLKPPRLWYQKKFITKSDPAYKIEFTNLLKDSDLSTYGIGDIWSSDLTYIKFQGVFLYLAIITDIVSKEVVDFNLSTHHDSELVLKTLERGSDESKTCS